MRESFQKRVKDLMNAAVMAKEVAGMNLLVLQDGREVLYEEAGDRDREEAKPFSRDTIFRLYSMSKPITAAAAILLLDRGILDLGEPVSAYLPEYADIMVDERGERKAPRTPMMIRDLMNMTSGLVYPGEMTGPERRVAQVFQLIDEKLDTDQAYTTRDIASMLAKQDLIFHPGEHFQYGTSADVLGAVIEEAAGEPFSEFLRKKLFEPLQMKDTGFFVPEEKRSRLAKIYHSENGMIWEERTRRLGISYELEREPAFASGGAGLVSTLDDYAHFAAMLLNGGVYDGKRILSEAAARFMTEGELLPGPQQDMTRNWESLPGYTYGNLMRVLKTPGRSLTLGVKGEYGWDGWLGAYFANDPVHHIALLMGMQKVDSGTWALTRKLRNVVFGELLNE